jgi:hypothetical protein
MTSTCRWFRARSLWVRFPYFLRRWTHGLFLCGAPAEHNDYVRDNRCPRHWNRER